MKQQMGLSCILLVLMIKDDVRDNYLALNQYKDAVLPE